MHFMLAIVWERYYPRPRSSNSGFHCHENEVYLRTWEKLEKGKLLNSISYISFLKGVQIITILAPHSTHLVIKYTFCVKINFTQLKRAFLYLVMKHPILASKFRCLAKI